MIYHVLIPLGLLFVPWLVARYVFKTPTTTNLSYKTHAWYLVAASLAWFAAMTLPNVNISAQTDTTTMHTMGGVVSAILFAYFMAVYKIKFVFWWQTWLALYFFVSGLGVLNELFELFLYKINYISDDGGDTWWDLAANTFGAFTAYLLIYVLKIGRK